MPKPDHETIALTIPPELAGQRLDRALATLLPDYTRARLQGLMDGGHIDLNGKQHTKASHKVAANDTVVVTVPPAIAAEPIAQKIPLTVVYEDDDLLVIDKPVGMVVHPAVGNYDGTLVNALLAHCGDSLSGINGVKRPGIVHRLDKETSGLMVVAKNDTAHNGLATQFAEHTARRTYMAVVHGMPTPEGTVNAHLGRDPRNRQRQAVLKENASGAKHAVTHYTRKAVYMMPNGGPVAALLECELETGRTHQIRVHMMHVGFPLVGDPLYGKKRALKNLPDAMRNFPRQALHAAQIRFTHPRTKKKLHFTSALPADMQQLIKALEKPILAR